MSFANYLLFTCLGLALVMVVSLAPQRLMQLLAYALGNAACALAGLVAVNLLGGGAGLYLPVNALTLSCGATMGLPGVAALAVLAAI
jgi:pro-sigmaK processing inhibitor BofA